jgi:hypothetical protein
MMPSRGMGDIRASKMPKAKVGKRKDGDEFTEYKKGGKVKSRVNEAGNYTKPGLSKAQFLSGLKQVVRAVQSGAMELRVKHKCWLSSIRKLAGVTKIEGSSKKPEELD